MSDLHLPQKMIIFAVGKTAMWFSLFCYSFQEGIQYASNQCVICVKSQDKMTQNTLQYALDGKTR